jgi:microsomal dipeptidase-like Zn-dependent dipeptidase
MKRGGKRIFVVVALVVAVALGLFFFGAARYVDGSYNKVIKPPPYAASERARELHGRLFIADLHADSLLWGRDLLERGTRGHTDVPRLIEGNVALQVFSLPTKTPRGLNIERNDDKSDNITLLALALRWPPRTWTSLKERALYNAGRLRAMAEASGGRLVVIRTKTDLSGYLKRRAGGEGGAASKQLLAGILAIEGAHALDGDPMNVDALFDAGFRMMSPTHFFDNEMGGSAHGIEKGGLTERGREMVRRMEARGMIVDLAHSSAQTIEDVLDISTRPVVVSHTGVKGTCDNTRNLTDEQLKRIAGRGGIIGIGFWETAVCGRDAKAVARAIRYTANLVGVEHVALGSDFDGAIAAPFDATGLVELTDALIAEGFDEREIRLIMGDNAVRMLLENLPE